MTPYAILDKQDRPAAPSSAAKDADQSRAEPEEQLADPNLGAALKKLESVVLRSDVVKNSAASTAALDQVRPITLRWKPGCCPADPPVRP